MSQSTVVRALANNPNVAAETRKKIVELAESMGYKPNPLVSTLMAFKRSVKLPRDRLVMGYLTSDDKKLPWREVKTFVDFYDGATERASTHGFVLEEFRLGEPKMTGRRMSEILYHRNVPGVIVGPMLIGRGHLSLDWSGLASAAIGYSMVRPRLHRATHNHLLGIRQAVRQLRKLGYRRIGLTLDTVHDARVDFNWSIGFTSYLYSLPATERVAPLIKGYPDYTPQEVVRWYKKQRPDVILSGSWWIHEWLRDAGIGIPDEVGFALLDRKTQDATSTVAGIDQNSRAVAAAAVDTVVAQLHRNERGLPTLCKTTLIEGFWSNGPTVRAQR
jgi:LacI family transcriptional regulator